ncbi:M23 family metallopeptidase [Nonomuraea sp. NPDC050643]|uniref:M23 family metallopeptidase n=1 Tax=Nonomuraea sp. NPDC050643 TaxID=3155660 RepID=UPI0033D64128
MHNKILMAGLCAAAFALPLAWTSTASAAAGPGLQLPFPCGETWAGSSKSSAHTAGNEIDFNGSAGDGNGDLGRTVVAAADGTVVMSEYRTTDGFGNVIKIRHSDGTVTLYAHLNARSVAKGATVRQGQKIGTVGKSSAKYKMLAHLHYEQRTASGAIVPATFNGVRFGYPNQKVTSKNCGGSGNGTPPPDGGGGSGNPYTATQVCGAGFKEIDSAPLGSQGRVALLYSTSSGQNCVVTLRKNASGKAAMRAYLEVKGKARATGDGSFQYYAGPVKAKALRTCVKWGGAIGSAAYDSPFEHCD